MQWGQQHCQKRHLKGYERNAVQPESICREFFRGKFDGGTVCACKTINLTRKNGFKIKGGERAWVDGRFASAETGGLSDCRFRVLFFDDRDWWLEGLSARKPPKWGCSMRAHAPEVGSQKRSIKKLLRAQITRQNRLSNRNMTNLQQFRRHGRMRLQPSQLDHSRALLEVDHDVSRWHFALRC